jgi:uncharacterized protein
MFEELIKNYTKELCDKKENQLTPHFFSEHIIIVKEYAEKLGVLLNGDLEVIKISSFLHDISVIKDFKTISTHTIESAAISESILSGINYPQNKIIQVKECILRHSAPIQINEGEIEEICVSNADAISQIANPTFWLYFSMNILSLDYIDAKKWYFNRLNSNWNLLIEPAKNLITNKYSIVREALFN